MYVMPLPRFSPEHIHPILVNFTAWWRSLYLQKQNPQRTAEGQSLYRVTMFMWGDFINASGYPSPIGDMLIPVKPSSREPDSCL
jgi:hypothetical protein